MKDSAVTLVASLAAARKSTQFYPAEHPNHKESVDALVAAVAECVTGGPFALNVHQGRLYAGSAVLSEEGPAISSIAEAMEARKVESFTFSPGFGDTDAIGLTEVLNLRPHASLDVEAELAQRQVENVRVASIVDEDAEEREEKDRVRERNRALYKRFISAMRQMSARIQSNHTADLKETGPLVGEIMRHTLDDPAAVLALATMRTSSDTALYHSVNVMIYALTLGAELGLPEEGLESLGVCALLHDVGKTGFDANDPVEADAMRTMHPSVGADILTRLQADETAPMLVAYEHHMGLDGTGWPARESDYVPHPFSRIVSIADRYENLTKPDASGVSLTPDKAVTELLREAGRSLDPIFSRLFVTALGVFPVGCMVRLSDLSVGAVYAKGDDPLLPKVRLIYDPSGIELEVPLDVDLASDGRTIVQVVEQEQLNVAVSDHL